MSRDSVFEELAIVYFDEIVRETHDAYLLDVGDDAERVWIPKSQVRELDVEGCNLTIPEWLAIEKGLE